MTRYDYERSRELAAADEPFYGLIMAAMRRSDTLNGNLLRTAYPDVWDELQARYNAPGGILPGEPGYDDVRPWQPGDPCGSCGSDKTYLLSAGEGAGCHGCGKTDADE